MPVVRMPDGVNVSFPDNMAPQAIRSLILRKFPNAADPAKQPAPAGPDFSEANARSDGAPATLVDALRSRAAAPASNRGDFQALATGADLHGQTPEDQLVEYGKPSALVSGLMGAADTVSVGTVDEISAALRSAVKGESYDEALARSRARLRTAQIEHPDLNSFLKEHNPLYRKAVEVGLDNIQADEALEFGRNALRMDPRVIARKMGEADSYGRDTVFSDGQKELARIGLVENLRDVVDSSGFTHNAIHKFFSSSEQIRRIRPFFRSKGDFQQFRAAIFNEVRKRKTYDAVRGNSTTARQLADMQDTGGLAETAGTVIDAARGGVVGAALSTLQRGLRRLGGLTPQTANEIGKLLMTADPEKVRGILNTLRRIEASSARADQKSAAIQGLLSRFAASEVGRALAPEPTPQMAVQYR